MYCYVQSRCGIFSSLLTSDMDKSRNIMILGCVIMILVCVIMILVCVIMILVCYNDISVL